MVLSFNVTWTWHGSTRLTCQGISITGTSDFLSHPYTSTSECLRGFTIRTVLEANYHPTLPAYTGSFKQHEGGTRVLSVFTEVHQGNSENATGCYYSMIILSFNINTKSKPCCEDGMINDEMEIIS